MLIFKEPMPQAAWAAQPDPDSSSQAGRKSELYRILFAIVKQKSTPSVLLRAAGRRCCAGRGADEELDGSSVAALSEGAVGDDQ
jgi:hypothetical protein